MRFVCAAAAALLFGAPMQAEAVVVLGTGTGALVGSDLTDRNDDGNEGSGSGFDASFFASEEEGFGGGEFAFNVFDNAVGGGNDKWCCGTANTAGPWIVGARFDAPVRLEAFTLTSGNDTPGRDPIAFRIEGSNDADADGNGTWTTLYSYDEDSSPWTARNQVLRFSIDDGDLLQNIDRSYFALRFIATETLLTAGPVFQLNEIEFIGTEVPLPASAWLMLAGLGVLTVARRRAV